MGIQALPIQASIVGPRSGVSSYLLSSFDPAASAFFNKGVALGQPDLSGTIKSAINDLVDSLKDESLWTTFIAIYPFVGSTDVWNSLNLANPEIFQITWGGAVTFDTNGITGNGSSGFGDTGIEWDDFDFDASASVSVYSRTTAAQHGPAISGPPRYQIYPRFDDDNAYYATGDEGDNIVVPSTDASGFLVASRTATNASAAYRNGAQVGTSSGTVTTSNNTVQLLRRDAGGDYSSYNLALCSAGSGLSAGQVAALYSIVQAFQTALGRNV